MTDQKTLDELWEQARNGLTAASKNLAYDQFPQLANRVRRELEQFAAMQPPSSYNELTKRQSQALAMIASWGDELAREYHEEE